MKIIRMMLNLILHCILLIVATIAAPIIIVMQANALKKQEREQHY